MMFYFMIAAFLVTVVGSTLLAFEYARIDSIAVDYKVEVFEHAVAAQFSSMPCGLTRLCLSKSAAAIHNVTQLWAEGV